MGDAAQRFVPVKLVQGEWVKEKKYLADSSKSIIIGAPPAQRPGLLSSLTIALL
jgi:hypothetical protein